MKITKQRRRNNQKGITITEFSLVATVFFLFLFAVIDLGLFSYVKMTMQHSVREGARYAITGLSDLDPDETSNREAAILQKIDSSSNGLLSRVMNVEDVRVTDINGNTLSGFGGPGDLIVIHLDCEWATTSPFIYPMLPDGKYQFTVSAAMKNETFDVL
ncbi:TadE/TadG family type IV pilus assembly protein [Vibrio maerlii]|uniref:TadE/TadG family type IV pilus assembly protein n=1 Tax=Vibrio maerlii TaxID=2231648 RepID=UPI000E3E920D|nr:TadE/TadG family type IV pilus assembly protein [Vibrio maerlii]